MNEESVFIVTQFYQSDLNMTSQSHYSSLRTLIMISIDWEINVSKFVRNKNQDMFISLYQIFLKVDYAAKLHAIHRS